MANLTKEELELEKLMNTPEYWGIGELPSNSVISKVTKSDIIKSGGVITKDLTSVLGEYKYEDLKKDGKDATFIDFLEKKIVADDKERKAKEIYDKAANSKIANGESGDDDEYEYEAVLED